MTNTQRGFITSFMSILVLIAVTSSYAAVTSIGEVNPRDNDQGIVPAGSTVTLVVTLIIDRSQAEPGEEIRTIEVKLPADSDPQKDSARNKNLHSYSPSFRSISVLRDRRQQNVRVEIAGENAFEGSSLLIIFSNLIADFSNSVYEIIFECSTPGLITPGIQNKPFRVLLRNPDGGPIGEAIKPGQADGKVNNDDFTLNLVPDTPPAPVEVFEAEIDPTGENDVIFTWQRSEERDVAGYEIFSSRDNYDRAIAIIGQDKPTVFRDVNVPFGDHKYRIAVSKGGFLKSEPRPVRVVVGADSAPPQPPENLEIVDIGTGNEIKVRVKWTRSPSHDVVKYQVVFGTSPNQLEPLPYSVATPEDLPGPWRISDVVYNPENRVNYEQIHRPPGTGVFFYALEATDEAGNKSPRREQDIKQHRILDAPAPNPFLPLSDNPAFNRVVFPARAIEGAEGGFFVLIFDINGAMVKELTAGPSDNKLEWDGRHEGGEVVESGVYVYQMQIGESFKTGTIIVAK